MGRYYTGDIEGQFWSVIQSSDAADRFGVYGSKPQYLEYFFNEEHLEAVEEELESIKDFLGDKIEKLDEFYKNDRLYCTDEDVSNYLGVSLKEIRNILTEYADYELGIKIRDAIKENGSCYFTAEF